MCVGEVITDTKKILIYISHILVIENTNLISDTTFLIIIKRYTHLRLISQVFFKKKKGHMRMGVMEN